jgi:hypothetical protein
VAGQRLSHGLALGCAGHHRASARPPLSACSAQPSGTQRRDARRRGGASLPLQQMHDVTVGSQKQRSATASSRTWVAQELQTVAGGCTRGSTGQRPGPERASMRAAIAVLAHTRPRHARSAQPSGNQRRNTRRSGSAPNVPCKTFHGSTADIHRDTLHGDGELGGMNGPGALTHRGAAVLRLEGQHTGG